MADLAQILAMPVVSFFAVVLAGLVSSKVGMFLIDKVVRKLTEKTKTTLDDRLLEALSGPIQLGIVAISVYVALRVTEGVSAYTEYVNKAGYIALVFFVTWMLSRTVGAFIGWYADKMEEREGGKAFLSKQILPFSSKAISILIFLAGIIVMLSYLGVEIAPLIGSLGIAGLAVALALQETLSNFFAGLYFLFDKPLRVGDFITLSEAQGATQLEGVVAEIGWRNTKLRMLNGSLILIPNAKLAQSTFTNRSLEGEEFADSVDVGVSYSSDPEKVLRILKAAAAKTIEGSPDAVKREPIVQIADFKDFSISFKVIFFAKSYKTRGQVRNALMFSVFKALKDNGIEIPLPTRVIINRPA